MRIEENYRVRFLSDLDSSGRIEVNHVIFNRNDILRLTELGDIEPIKYGLDTFERKFIFRGMEYKTTLICYDFIKKIKATQTFDNLGD